MVSVAACWTTSSLIMSSASVISLIFGLMVEGRSSDFGCCTTIGNTEDNTRTCHNYHCHYGPRSKYIPLLVMVMVMGGSSGGVGYGLRPTADGGSRQPEAGNNNIGMPHGGWRADDGKTIRPVRLSSCGDGDRRSNVTNGGTRCPSFEIDDLANISTIQLYQKSLKAGFGRCHGASTSKTLSTTPSLPYYYYHHEDRIPSHPHRLSRCLRSLYFTNGILTTTSPCRCHGRCGKVSS